MSRQEINFSFLDFFHATLKKNFLFLAKTTPFLTLSKLPEMTVMEILRTRFALKPRSRFVFTGLAQPVLKLFERRPHPGRLSSRTAGIYAGGQLTFF